MIKLILILSCCILPILIHAQELDTIKIYPKNFGLSSKKYQKILLEGKNSYRTNKLNHIDSLLFLRKNSFNYIKLYNKENTLILEGKLGEYEKVVGSIKLYYLNGNLKEERYISEKTIECKVEFDNKVDAVLVSDNEGTNWGHWKFYNKNGKLKKERIYSC